MSYSLTYQPVQHSSQVYTGIKCHSCQKTSYNLDDIETRRCSFCKTTHTSQAQPKSTAKYHLFWGASKKSKKAHWSVNGNNALCMVGVVLEVERELDPGLVCVNCANLKARGIKR